MYASLRTTSLLLAVALALGGCTTPFIPRGQLPLIDAVIVPDEATPEASNSTAAAVVPTEPTASATPDQDSMEQLKAELQTVKDLDPETLATLIADLTDVQPSLRPAMVRQYRAALAFRQQLAEREANDNTATPPAATAAQETPPLVSPPPVLPIPAQSAVVKPPGPLPTLQAALSPLNPTLEPPQVTRPATETSLSVSQAALSVAVAEGSDVTEQTPTNNSAHATVATVTPAVPDLATTTTSLDTEISDWKHNLDAAITALEMQTREAPRTVDEVGKHARLRMLYLASGRRDDTMRPIPGVLPAEQDFWTEQLYALATYLGNDQLPDPGKRAAEAKRHLTNAVDKLGELGTLAVRNLAICTDVYGFGSYKEFDSLEFAPGDKVLVYSEVENYRSKSTEKGFLTTLRVSYEILDSDGHRVEQIQPPDIEDYCASRRRDFHIRHFVDMPQRMYDGTYTLQVTVEDTQGQKIGQSKIEFTVKEKG